LPESQYLVINSAEMLFCTFYDPRKDSSFRLPNPPQSKLVKKQWLGSNLVRSWSFKCKLSPSLL